MSTILAASFASSSALALPMRQASGMPSCMASALLRWLGIQLISTSGLSSTASASFSQQHCLRRPAAAAALPAGFLSHLYMSSTALQSVTILPPYKHMLKALAAAVHSAAVTDSPGSNQPTSDRHSPSTKAAIAQPTTLASGSLGWRPEPSTKINMARQVGLSHRDSCCSSLHCTSAGSFMGTPNRPWQLSGVAASAKLHLLPPCRSDW